MRNLLQILTGIVTLMLFSIETTAQISGTSDPFIFDTTSAAVPLSGIAIGVVLVLILGFLARQHMHARKRAGI